MLLSQVITGITDTKNIFVIDTPGLLDPEGKDKIQF